MCFVHYGQTSPLWADKGNCSRGPWFVQQSWQLISACSVLWHKCCGCIWCIWASGPNCYLCLYCVWKQEGCTCIKNLGFNTKWKQWLDDLNNLKKNFLRNIQDLFIFHHYLSLIAACIQTGLLSIFLESLILHDEYQSDSTGKKVYLWCKSQQKNRQSQQTAPKEQGGSSIRRP